MSNMSVTGAWLVAIMAAFITGKSVYFYKIVSLWQCINTSHQKQPRLTEKVEDLRSYCFYLVASSVVAPREGCAVLWENLLGDYRDVCVLVCVD